MRWYQRSVHGEISSASRHSGRGSVTFPAMSYKLCLGLFLILAVIVLGSADDQSQDLDLSDKLSRVAREAETTNGKKKNDKKTKKIKRKRNRAKKGRQTRAKQRRKMETKARQRKKEDRRKRGKTTQRRRGKEGKRIGQVRETRMVKLGERERMEVTKRKIKARMLTRRNGTKMAEAGGTEETTIGTERGTDHQVQYLQSATVRLSSL